MSSFKCPNCEKELYSSENYIFKHHRCEELMTYEQERDAMAKLKLPCRAPEEPCDSLGVCDRCAERGVFHWGADWATEYWKNKGSGEFDKNKSQGDMPRRYEHIDRVDLWIMAQEKYYNSNAATIAALRAELEQLKGKEKT